MTTRALTKEEIQQIFLCRNGYYGEQSKNSI